MNSIGWLGFGLFVAGMGGLLTFYVGLRAVVAFVLWTMTLVGLLAALVGLNQ